MSGKTLELKKTEIKYTIKPENVTFEDVGCELTAYYNDEGAACVEVYIYSGNCRDNIIVTVEYSVFDRFQIFFEVLFADIASIFA